MCFCELCRHRTKDSVSAQTRAMMGAPARLIPTPLSWCGLKVRQGDAMQGMQHLAHLRRSRNGRMQNGV